MVHGHFFEDICWVQYVIRGYWRRPWLVVLGIPSIPRPRYPSRTLEQWLEPVQFFTTTPSHNTGFCGFCGFYGSGKKIKTKTKMKRARIRKVNLFSWPSLVIQLYESLQLWQLFRQRFACVFSLKGLKGAGGTAERCEPGEPGEPGSPPGPSWLPTWTLPGQLPGPQWTWPLELEQHYPSVGAALRASQVRFSCSCRVVYQAYFWIFRIRKTQAQKTSKLKQNREKNSSKISKKRNQKPPTRLEFNCQSSVQNINFLDVWALRDFRYY